MQRNGAGSRRCGGSRDDDVRECADSNTCIARVAFGYDFCLRMYKEGGGCQGHES